MPAEAAYRQATTAEVVAIAQELQAMLGQKLVAFITNVESVKTVGRWAAGGNPPREEPERRLRALYRTVLTLQEAYGPETIRAWLLGANPDLGNEAPAQAIRDRCDPAVFDAARHFVV